jgi:hypothetical protein
MGKRVRFLTFICGRAGVCALGAVIAKHCNDQLMVTHFLSSFDEVGFWEVQFLFSSESSMLNFV